MTVYKQHKKLLSWCTYTTATFALGNINNVAWIKQDILMNISQWPMTTKDLMKEL